MLLRKSLIAVWLVVAAWEANAQADPDKKPGEASRGELLYSTHCIACHTSQVHWRDQRLANDWSSLKAQVRRWASNTGLQWEEQDVNAVARYLNRMYYDFPSDQESKIVSERPRN
jgi:hypothetical protein